MRKVTAFFLVLLLMTGAAFSAMAYKALPAEETLRVNAHLRAEPSAESESKMILMAGYKVTVLDVANYTWLYVQYGHKTGYIRGDLIVPSTGTGPALGIYSGGDRPTLRKRSTGDDVFNLEMQLHGLGLMTGYPDTVFDEETEQAVRRLQQLVGLTPDGVMGAKTYAALDLLLASIYVTPPEPGDENWNG